MVEKQTPFLCFSFFLFDSFSFSFLERAGIPEWRCVKVLISNPKVLKVLKVLINLEIQKTTKKKTGGKKDHLFSFFVFFFFFFLLFLFLFWFGLVWFGLVCWLVAWLVGVLVGWLVCWLVGWCVG